MASNPNKKKQAIKKKPALRIEQLEPRQMFSATPTSAPPIEHMLVAPPAEHMQEPLVGASEAAPPLSSPWTPLVYAGADITISQNETANLNGEAIVNLPLFTSVSWNLLSGPGNATFGDSTTTTTTAQFSDAGTYELELTVVNNGIAASDRVTVNVTTADVINIDQAWLDAQGEGPYYLDQQGKTYVLQTDVTTDGTAFAIINDNIVFDLNGHTITYGNAAPITVFNGSFESGTGAAADGWDFSNAINGERYQGSFFSNDIYEGDYSLKFNSGFTGEQLVLSTGTITLAANTTYSLSAMFGNRGDVTNASSFVKLIGQDVAEEHEVIWSKKNYRGIQFKEGVFTTGESGGTYKIAAGVDNPDGNADFSAYIDDIKLQLNRVYGVAVRAMSWDSLNYPGLTQFGDGNDAVIKNGAITQGQNYSTYSHGIYDRAERTEIAHTTITVAGANSSAISGPFASAALIHDNTLISNVQTIGNRDQFEGAVIHKTGGQIYNNTIVGGPHAGIYNGGRESVIHSNHISIRSKYTNGFAIMLYDDQGSEVYDNVIDNTSSDYSGRGIHVQRATLADPDNLTILRDNTVSVRELARNQEYGGVVLGGAYGIQLEGAQDVEISGNNVVAIAEDSDAYAFRKSVRDDEKRNVFVHHNTFRAVRLNTDVQAASLRLNDITAVNELRFENNLLISNHGWIGNSGSITDLTFAFNELRVEGDGTGFEPVQASNYGSGAARDARAITGLQFVDNVYTNTLSQQVFVSSPIGNYFIQQPTDPSSSLQNGYTITFQVKNLDGTALANATVTIVDKDGNQMFTGNSDVNGQVTTLLQEFTLQGDQKSDFGPYTITVAHNGDQTQQQFSVDQTQTIDVQLSINSSSLATENTQLLASELKAGIALESFTLDLQVGSGSSTAIDTDARVVDVKLAKLDHVQRQQLSLKVSYFSALGHAKNTHVRNDHDNLLASDLDLALHHTSDLESMHFDDAIEAEFHKR